MTDLILETQKTEDKITALKNCVPKGYFFKDRKLKSIILPEGIKKIGDYAFAGCESLKEIVLPESVVEIGEYAFWNCISLKKIVLPPKIKIIEECCFSNCISLEKIEFPKNLKVIGSHAFENCIKLQNIEFPKKLEKISWGAFYGCYEIGGEYGRLIFPHSLKLIEPRAFDKTLLSSALIYDETKAPFTAFDINYDTRVDIEINRKSTTFETERLIIRPLQKRDYKTTKPYTCDKENTYWMISLFDVDEESFDNYFEASISEWDFPDVRTFLFAVCLKDSGLHIGEIILDTTLHNPFETGTINIGWIFSRDYHNKGYCTEAASAVIYWAKKHIRTRTVNAECDIKNPASRRVMEKLGMEYEDASPRKYSDGRESETVYYSLEIMGEEEDEDEIL